MQTPKAGLQKSYPRMNAPSDLPIGTTPVGWVLLGPTLDPQPMYKSFESSQMTGAPSEKEKKHIPKEVKSKPETDGNLVCRGNPLQLGFNIIKTWYEMVDPEPCKELRRRPQLYMVGIVPTNLHLPGF